MPSKPRSSYAAFALSALSLTGAVASAHAHGVSPLDRKMGTMNKKRAALSYSGCYSSSDGLSSVGSYTYQSSGYCQQQCAGKNQAVLGLTKGSDCWCGESLPEASSKVDDSKCNTPCTGYGQDECGGTNYWSVYLTGTESDVSNYGGSASSSSAAASTATPTSSSTTTAATPSTSTSTSAPSTVITSVSPGTTIIVTQPAHATATASATPTKSSKSGGSNTAGIAAGAVVGVMAAAAIIAAIFFWIRHKKKQEADAGYRPGQDYKGGELRPPPTAYSQMSDARLDPEAGRRNSSGSIADDQDYSRRILRVANPSD
ncbi:cell wall integrity and stress response component 1-like [Teratosphaeria destructans]|uniref:Cell wall integrity and stress response component 1-like n=1 Tax=Teratosphaeria destructans TaxID=418781 RepID=A0A9W7W3V0_9PEZI|nr:cell wall integrity and stress response component 1-like [Teratosphaeria destructans]